MFTIPYGPVRSGIFEAIQFRIETGGEDVPHLQTRPFFKHRGMERRFVGLAPEVAVHVAERVAGIASHAYASAFSEAVERALGVEAAAAGAALARVYCELERMACHLDVIAKEAETHRAVRRSGALSDPQGAGAASARPADGQSLRTRG